MKGELFQVPGGGSYDLQSIIPYKNSGADICEHTEFTLWWWDTTTLGNKYAQWSEYYVAETAEDEASEAYDEGYVFESAWTTRADEPIKYRGDTAKTFAAGEGFFVQPACANPVLTISGEVIGTTDTTSEYRKVAFTEGQKQLVISPFPVAVGLQDIVPMKGEAVCEHTEFTLWWWDTTALANKYAQWSEYYVAETAEDEASEAYDEGYVFETAWTTRADEPIKYRGDTAKTFAVGEGFYIQPACASPYLAFPNPFYVAD